MTQLLEDALEVRARQSSAPHFRCDKHHLNGQNLVHSICHTPSHAHSVCHDAAMVFVRFEGTACCVSGWDKRHIRASFDIDDTSADDHVPSCSRCSGASEASRRARLVYCTADLRSIFGLHDFFHFRDGLCDAHQADKQEIGEGCTGRHTAGSRGSADGQSFQLSRRGIREGTRGIGQQACCA